jgi:hypothetical protein
MIWVVNVYDRSGIGVDTAPKTQPLLASQHPALCVGLDKHNGPVVGF